MQTKQQHEPASRFRRNRSIARDELQLRANIRQPGINIKLQDSQGGVAAGSIKERPRFFNRDITQGKQDAIVAGIDHSRRPGVPIHANASRCIYPGGHGTITFAVEAHVVPLPADQFIICGSQFHDQGFWKGGGIEVGELSKVTSNCRRHEAQETEKSTHDSCSEKVRPTAHEKARSVLGSVNRAIRGVGRRDRIKVLPSVRIINRN